MVNYTARDKLKTARKDTENGVKIEKKTKLLDQFVDVFLFRDYLSSDALLIAQQSLRILNYKSRERDLSDSASFLIKLRMQVQ